MTLKTAFLAAAVFCCAGGAALAHDMKLEGTEWGFVGDQGPKGRFVSFAGQQRIFGFSGCNRFSGEFLQSNEQLMIKPLATTRMACPPEQMKREEEFLSALGKVRSTLAEHSLLVLLDEKGAQLVTLVRRGGE